MRKVKQIVKQNGLLGMVSSRGKSKNEFKNGAGDGIRTRDVLLGRQALCHWVTPARILESIKYSILFLPYESTRSGSCLVTFSLGWLLFRPSLNSPSVQLLKLELSVIIFNKIILTNSKKRGMVSLVLITAGILVQLAKKKKSILRKPVSDRF